MIWLKNKLMKLKVKQIYEIAEKLQMDIESDQKSAKGIAKKKTKACLIEEILKK